MVQVMKLLMAIEEKNADLWINRLDNWVQNGYNFEMLEKEESRKSLTYRTLP